MRCCAMEKLIYHLILITQGAIIFNIRVSPLWIFRESSIYIHVYIILYIWNQIAHEDIISAYIQEKNINFMHCENYGK
jgi:hypothetical protein